MRTEGFKQVLQNSSEHRIIKLQAGISVKVYEQIIHANQNMSKLLQTSRVIGRRPAFKEQAMLGGIDDDVRCRVTPECLKFLDEGRYQSLKGIQPRISFLRVHAMNDP